MCAWNQLQGSTDDRSPHLFDHHHSNAAGEIQFHLFFISHLPSRYPIFHLNRWHTPKTVPSLSHNTHLKRTSIYACKNDEEKPFSIRISHLNCRTNAEHHTCITFSALCLFVSAQLFLVDFIYFFCEILLYFIS